ncbi:MAG: AbrB family transcriptional regulator [Desulfosarcina sp.]|nr:AbrB family transcriptional regulator [Desulfosarcina sp.]MBC2764544.1 AbrB family transcriptional regulator [Desulfosarcina sp.]
METGTLSSKGQITIPKKIRDFLHIQTSEKLIFVPLEEGKVLITTEQKSASSIFGMLKHKKKKQPVSLEQMDSAIQKRRLGRVLE